MICKSFKSFFKKHDREFPSKIEKIDVKKQYQNIDILLTVNDTIAIPIEDKIGTREHSNQLQRYLEILEKVR
ncbi:PD-(D/E)XK nuclease family protein [Rhodoferax sp. 4810]|uniref:PD-(D/E)XK nuclease family protein n=1 Tax=Thiospirillum jenense TaxID=1653858 RepID=A0A839HKW5_9GAMM|nr:PD-(D/E)XK nuclease family protein [Rhodoferax jenense]MBB1127386.1 PD-(D/E)XK nuclease family protein [Thiospirillum jenense]